MPISLCIINYRMDLGKIFSAGEETQEDTEVSDFF